jgi:hypothetical protein
MCGAVGAGGAEGRLTRPKQAGEASLDGMQRLLAAARLQGMCDRFSTTLGCVDIGFIPDDTLDQIPLPCHLGNTRVGGIDLNRSGSAPPRRRLSPYRRHPAGYGRRPSCQGVP